MFYKITKDEFLSSPTFYSFAYEIEGLFYVQPFDDVEPKGTWIPITKEEFESNKPVFTPPKTEEQTKIEQLEAELSYQKEQQAQTSADLQSFMDYYFSNGGI